MTAPRAASYALASIFALALGIELLWMPVQVSDSLGEILDAQQTSSAAAAFVNSASGAAYLRPMRIAQIKALFDVAAGEHYWLAYRGFHALLLVSAMLLFVAGMRVETRADFAACACALVVLIGARPFRGTVQEAFPINHFLEMVVACLLTLTLARSRGGWRVDATALVTFAVAALTLESGLIVWIVAAAAWAVRWRGISTRGVAAMTFMLAAYVYVRFAYLSTGLPDLSERSSGFLFGMLDGEQLQERFGAQPAWFYLYNVATSALSVLFSEPTGGVFMTTAAWLDGDVPPRLILPVVTSTATTGLVAWAAVRELRARRMGDTARFVIVFAAVLAANSLLSYAYTKDDIMSVAGAFYALGAYAAVRILLGQIDRVRPVVATAMIVLAAVLAVGWSIRAAGVHYVLRTYAFRAQNDWTQVPVEWRREGRWPEEAESRRLIQRLHSDAVGFELPNTRIGTPRWPDRIWEE